VADERNLYAKGDRVEVRRMAGWKPGTVVSSAQVPGEAKARLFYVLVDGDKFERAYRADQLRLLKAEPDAQACAQCAEVLAENVRLAQENEGLRTQVQLVTNELRKWVEVG
jgi:hypothetical protein